MSIETQPYRYEAIALSNESTVVAEFLPDALGVRETGYQSEAALEKAFIEQLQLQAYEYLTISSEAELVANLRRETDPDEAYLEAKLAWKLSRAQLAVLREICAWREHEARARDLPRNRVVREHALWPLAKTQPDNLVALARIEDMHPRTVRQDGETLLKLIKSAGQIAVADWPEPLPEPLPADASTLLKKLRAVGQAEAERQGIVVELMLRKKSLEALLISGYPNGPYQLPDNLRGWRRELMGDALLAALEN